MNELGDQMNSSEFGEVSEGEATSLVGMEGDDDLEPVEYVTGTLAKQPGSLDDDLERQPYGVARETSRTSSRRERVPAIEDDLEPVEYEAGVEGDKRVAGEEHVHMEDDGLDDLEPLEMPETAPGQDDDGDGEASGRSLSAAVDPRNADSAQGADRQPAGATSSREVGQGEDLPRLPDVELAAIPDEKFTRYSMDPSNPNNGGKWAAWEKLGYDVHTQVGRAAAARDVVKQLRDQLPRTTATWNDETRWGARYNTATEIVGPDGTAGTLVAVWQLDRGTDPPRMITNWVKFHR
jgi:hypothetical protein